MPRRLSTGTEWTGWAIIVLTVIFVTLVFFTLGCSSSPKKPTTHTPVPALGTSKEITRSIRSDIADNKDAISNARRLRQTIDSKLSVLEDWK